MQRLFQCFDKPVHLDFSQFDRATVVSFLRYLYTGTVPHRNGMGQVTMLALRYSMYMYIHAIQCCRLIYYVLHDIVFV